MAMSGMSTILLLLCVNAVDASNSSDGLLSLDAFAELDVAVYEHCANGDYSIERKPMPKCSNGLKVVLQPGESYGYSVDEQGVFDVVVANGTLFFARSDYQPSTQAPPGATINIQMPSSVLTRLSISAGNAVNILPGFQLDRVDIEIDGDARLFSSSLCAKTFSKVHLSGEGAAAHLIAPLSCGNVSIEDLTVTNGATLGIDLDLLLNAAGEIVSGGAVHGTNWMVTSGARASISAGSGEVSEVTVSGGAEFYAKGINVEHFNGKDGAKYAVEDGVIDHQDTFGEASRAEFEVQAKYLSPENLGPWFMTDCSYQINEDFVLEWWVTLIVVLVAGLFVVGGIFAIVYVASRRPQSKHVAHVQQHSVAESAI